MKIVLLDGGLSNQMTQYTFARCLQEETQDEVYLDDLWFHVPHMEMTKTAALVENHDYQLNKFKNIKKVPLMSEYFGKATWDEIIRRSIEKGPLNAGSWLPQILKDMGLQFFMIAEAPVYQFDGMVARMPYYYCMPEMVQAQGNVYYFGWFANGGWLMRHEELLRQELELPDLVNEEDLKLADEIEQSYSVGVHIRCSGGYKIQGIAYWPQYYNDRIQIICKLLETKKESLGKEPHFFVFSDDIAWCKENITELGLGELPYPVTFSLEKRGPDDSQNDMKLMSMCDVLLLNNSVYGYMGALLNRKPDKIILNPIPSRGLF
jgi:hypothetical protein